MSVRYGNGGGGGGGGGGMTIATTGWGAGAPDSAALWSSDKARDVRDLFETLEVLATPDLVPFFEAKLGKFLQQPAGVGRGSIKDVRDVRLGREGDTLLHCACKCGNRRIVRLLIDAGCDLDAYSSPLTLVTPLMTCIVMGHSDMVLDLVNAGARLDLQDYAGNNTFHYLARAGSTKLLKQVVAAAQLSGRVAQVLACQSDHQGRKAKLPENVAANLLMAQVVRSYRETGTYNPPERARDRAAAAAAGKKTRRG